uniref:Calpain 13 n=1 Tax=Neovison vison TaxID=452646 RepID=A0A8C7EWK7_NEOVI
MAHNQEPLAKTPVIKFNGQDFTFLRDRCLSRGLPFEDETFPAEPSSIGLHLLQGKDISSLRWVRPKDILNGKSEPHFILEGASRFDIQQGDAGDCWFLAALGSLTLNQQHLQKILMDQSFSHQYAGIFRFRFWQCGQWVEVVVDDRLPVLKKEYLFVRPRSNNQEFWPCLLEKAYAKFHGSYANLHYGFLPDALVDLTGGVVTNIDLNFPSDLVMMVKTAAKAGSLITCATLPTGVARSLTNGLVSQHAYTVTGAERIQTWRSWEDLIRLWNPWGHTEWRGRWSDESLEWQKIPDQQRRQLHENKEDGEFWMSCQDFRDNFSCLHICNQFPVSLNQGNVPHERWFQMMFKNTLSHAEGLSRDTQSIFSVPEGMESNNTIMSINTIPQNLKAKDKFPLSLSVFKFQHYQKLPPTFFSKFRNAIEGISSKNRGSLTKRYSLSPGTYVAVTSAHSETVEFLLRIFLKMPDGLGSLNASLASGRCAARLLGTEGAPVFLSRLDQELNLDAAQLQNLLNQELLTGKVRPHQPPVPTLLLLLNQSSVPPLKVNGRLEQEEFARLWGRLVHCQRVFQNIQSHSGVFLSLDLWKAVRDAGFLAGISVSNELLDLMTLRYGDNSGRVSFPSLVCLLLRLEAMAKTFQNLSKDGKGLYLTEMEVRCLPFPDTGHSPRPPLLS